MRYDHAHDVVMRDNPAHGLSIRNQYDAAKGDRRLRTWRPGSPGPNDAVIRELTELRNRARDLARNNPWITRGLDSWVANEIGCGITFKAASPDAEFNKRADDLFERQSEYVDANGQYDFAGMQSLVVRTRRIVGEIFLRRRLRRPSDGLPVPLQYQLLEPEFCPHSHNQIVGNGVNVRAGIQFDPIGRRQAYWMYRQHPDDQAFASTMNNFDLFPIPASEILHHYDPLRPGQIRGVPAITQAMVKARDFDDYDDAELVRKKNRSAFTGAITRPVFDPETDALYDPLTGEPVNKDFAGVPVTDIQAGQFFSLLPSEDVKLFDGDTTGTGYADFMRQQLLGIGAGQDVPYEFISGDFSKLNDRTLRVVLAEYHRSIERARWQLTIPQVCYPIWRDVIETAIASGSLEAPADFRINPEPYLKVVCHPEGWPYLHALQDIEADVLALKAGLTSRKRIKSEDGEDVREIDAERREDLDREKQLNLTSDFGSKPAADANQNADAAPSN